MRRLANPVTVDSARSERHVCLLSPFLPRRCDLAGTFHTLPGGCYIGVFRRHVWKNHPAMMLIINVNRLLRYAGCCVTFF
ncbi:hypothetical protein B6N31_14740 [Dickeya fangzhongdai]|nr:hypothetical protein B6N31_14740 [Dickeya fangzhongdai]